MRALFELFDVFEEVTDEEQRRFGAVIEKLQAAGDEKQKITWDEFMSYFGQNRYDFRGLMKCLAPTSEDAANRISTTTGEHKHTGDTTLEAGGATVDAGGDGDSDSSDGDSVKELGEDGLVELETEFSDTDEEPEYMIGREEVRAGHIPVPADTSS